MICPVCHERTDQSDYGHVQGRHIFRCKKCGHWLEEIKALRQITKADPIRRALEPLRL